MGRFDRDELAISCECGAGFFGEVSCNTRGGQGCVGERVGHRKNSKGQKVSGVNSKGKSFVVGGSFWRNGCWIGLGLSGGCRGNEGNEFGSILLEICWGRGGSSLERGGAHVRG